MAIGCAWSVRSGDPEKNSKLSMLSLLLAASWDHLTSPFLFRCRWHMGSWGPCSATCGVGIQTRDVHCLHPGEPPTPAEECRDEKPHALRACNQFDCPPSWHIEEWQQVRQPGDSVASPPRSASRESHADPPPFASSVSQDVWWGDSASEGHLPAAVNGWQLSESVGWIMPRAQGVVS